MTTPSVSDQSKVRDNLFAGPMHVVTESAVISSGQNLTRGAVLGRITASGEYVLSLSGAADGSETPAAILLDDTDASSGAKQANVALTGEFNENQLTLGASHTVASIRRGLEDLGIFIKGADAAGAI